MNTTYSFGFYFEIVLASVFAFDFIMDCVKKHNHGWRIFKLLLSTLMAMASFLIGYPHAIVVVGSIILMVIYKNETWVGSFQRNWKEVNMCLSWLLYGTAFFLAFAIKEETYSVVSTVTSFLGGVVLTIYSVSARNMIQSGNITHPIPPAPRVS